MQRIHRPHVSVSHVDMRQRMVATRFRIHGDDDPIKTTELGHTPSPSQAACTAFPWRRGSCERGMGEGGTLRQLGHGRPPSVRTGSLQAVYKRTSVLSIQTFAFLDITAFIRKKVNSQPHPDTSHLFSNSAAHVRLSSRIPFWRRGPKALPRERKEREEKRRPAISPSGWP